MRKMDQEPGPTRECVEIQYPWLRLAFSMTRGCPDLGVGIIHEKSGRYNVTKSRMPQKSPLLFLDCDQARDYPTRSIHVSPRKRFHPITSTSGLESQTYDISTSIQHTTVLCESEARALSHYLSDTIHFGRKICVIHNLKHALDPI